ncbi:FAD binding domain-containing protein [Sulfobacillus harzensis]|uniref:Xanthine dehydrogenase family protein subunit M n=1 Tax=Sulfobacillus harzensis TaxID=2729629 RepID=A0A7Y0L5C4_9FIRM|nr:FAD binding domain-containing protein [Sulfobacillus harzensis]NMP23242.1 xanthine dehydrogenase family protein subunit M [Sulfobacillus harzensis]
MKPAPFQYQQAQSLDDALSALNQPGAKVIAGGQSLVPLMNFRLSRPETVVDINGLSELSGVSERDGKLVIGAMTRHQELLANSLIAHKPPVLQEAARHIGHWAIRSRGTIGGSAVHADPAAELPAALVALEATVVVRSLTGERSIPAQDFFQGFYTTALEENELVVRFEVPIKARRMGFSEVVRRPGDFALVGAFVEVGDTGGAVTWFGLAARPERQLVDAWKGSEEARRETLERLAQENAVDPEEEYKYALAVTVAERAYHQAVKEG